MTKLLYIQASPRHGASRSIAVADAYLAALKAANPSLEVDVIELWDAGLPEFDGNRNEAKLTVFTVADRYLFAIPMWNGGIPYKLKQYIDLIHQPGLTFGFDPEKGYFGLLKDKQATLVYTSGAFSEAFASPAFGVDHPATYMRSWLNQAGITDLEEIRYQPTILTADSDGDFARAKAEATRRAR